MKKPELLAPAGDFESLEAAVHYGADAVYLGGRIFSMRASPSNFDYEQLCRAVEFAHRHGVKVHLTCNTLPRSGELDCLPRFFEEAKSAGVDALIICDLGVLELAKRHAKGIELHASTQTGIVNYAAACALHTLGAARVVLSRELSLAEIAVLRENTPRSLEIEAFVHGAMCVSFSGRCLLSSYLVSRDANRGQCAQPCRWKYALCESSRPGEYMPIEEDAAGTYILNARDLCMIEHIPALMRAGISSFKIEGRAKSAYYTAVVTNAYRIAIDRFFAEPERWRAPDLVSEVKKVSHRDYCTGFFFGPIEKGQIYDRTTYLRDWDIAAEVLFEQDGLFMCRVRNPFSVGDGFEALEPGKTGRPAAVQAIIEENGRNVPRAVHPNERVLLRLSETLCAHALLRKPAEPS